MPDAAEAVLRMDGELLSAKEGGACAATPCTGCP